MIVFIYFFFIDCGVELNILSNEDIARIRSGEMYEKECDTLSMKMTTGIINLCVNMVNIRNDATDSMLKYLMTNIEKQKPNASFQKESIFECFQVDEKNVKEEKAMLNTKICGSTITAAENEIVSEICTDDNFELDEFTIKDDNAFNTKSIDFDLLKGDESDDFNFF